MTNRYFRLLLSGACLLALASPAAAQSSDDGWSVPRTADGHPDLQGVWASDSATPLSGRKSWLTRRS